MSERRRLFASIRLPLAIGVAVIAIGLATDARPTVEGDVQVASAAAGLANPGFEDGTLDASPVSWTVTQPVPDVVRVVDAEGPGEFPAYADMGGISVSPYRGDLMLRAGQPRRVAQNQDDGRNGVTQTFVAESSTLSFAIRVFSWEHRNRDEIFFNLRQGTTTVGSLAAPFVLSPANGSPSTCSAMPCSLRIDVGQNGQFLDSGWIVVDITAVPTGVPLTFEFAAGGTNDSSHGTWAYLDSTEDAAEPPVAKFTFDPLDPNEGDTVQFIDQSFDPQGADIVSWDWVINGETFASTSPVYVFSDDGEYDATLTITNSDGESTTITDGETALDDTLVPELIVGSADPLVNALNVEALAGGPAPLFGRFAEPGWADAHTAEWTVDGSPVADSLEEDNFPAYGTGVVTGETSSESSVNGQLSVGDADGGTGSDAFTLTIVPDDPARHEPNDGVAAIPVLQSDGSYLSYIQTAGDIDVYEVKLPGGQALPLGAEVLVTLRDLPADYDAALLSLTPAGAPGVAAGDSGQTSFNTTPFARSPFARSPFARSPFARSPFARSPFARSSFTFDQLPLSELGFLGLDGEAVTGTDIGLGELGLETLEATGVRVAAFSANRGLEQDVVFARTAVDGTRILIAVTGANNEFNTAPYRLQVEASAPIDLVELLGSAACTGSSLVPGGPSSTAVLHDFAGAPKTLFVTQRERMMATHGLDAAGWDAVLADLATLSAHAAVQGEVISLPASIYDAWDIAPCSIDAANALSEQVRGILQPMLAGVEYVVFVGDDGIVPFRRVPDETAISNERDYSLDAFLRPGSALFASVALGFNLTDDYYTDADPSAWQGRQLFVPDVPVSRLVETPDEIRAQAQAFVASNGELNPSSGFVSGYDFFSDGSEAVADSLAGAVPTDELINDTWTADDLRCGLLGTGGCTPPSLAAPNAHFTHYGALSADGFAQLDLDDFLASTEVSAATDALAGSIVFTIGCHAGFNAPDGDSASVDAGLGIDPAHDFAQAMAIQRAVFIASTGFGLGDDAGLGGTEALMAIFAEGLVAGDVTAGNALVAAKQQYVLNTAAFTVYDEKSTINTTLYGLPMYRVVTAVPLVQQNVAPAAIAPELSLTINDGLNSSNVVVPYTEQTLDDGTVIAAGGDTQSTAARPVQPRVVVEPPAGVPVHSAIITGGAYEDIDPFDPVIARPTTEWEDGAGEPPVCLPSFWPSQLAHVRSLLTLGGLEQRLVVIPAQFRCDSGAGSAALGLERLYSQLTVELLRCAEGDFVAPAIQRIELLTEGTTVHANIDASDANGIVRIIALRFSGGAIVPTVLNVGPEDEGPYEMDVPDVAPGDRLVFQVQDGACNVASGTGKGVKLTALQIDALGDGQFVPDEPESFPVKIFGADYTLPLYFEWDFGDGTIVSGTLQAGDLTPDGLGNVTFDIVHTYANPGVIGTAHVTILDADGGVAIDTVPVGCDAASDDDNDDLSICAELGLGTDPADIDTDGDGCADGEEVLQPNHVFGGQRNPLDFWDFFDVTNDQTISADLGDTLLILGHFGHFEQDSLDNLLDRFVPNIAEPWRSAEANDGIDLIDALANLQSFGDSCAGPP